MRRYLTGLVTTDYWRFTPFPYRSRHWSLSLTKTARSQRHTEHASIRGKDGTIHERVTRGREVVIHARNELAAHKVAFLLQACGDLLDGSAFMTRLAGPLELCGADETRGDGFEKRAIRCSQGIPLECMAAVKIAAKLCYVYALAKLWTSYQLCSRPAIDLDPTHSGIIRKSPYPVDHVAYAQAILLANETIEELGLEVRASKSKPSSVNGQWNPVVKRDLEARLGEARVRIEEKFPWDIRGPKTVLEEARPARVYRKTPWARWLVRDAYVQLIDAIAHVGWLRSKVGAHRLHPRFARALSAYDVANAQFLARRLLLETLGLWRSL